MLFLHTRIIMHEKENNSRRVGNKVDFNYCNFDIGNKTIKFLNTAISEVCKNTVSSRGSSDHRKRCTAV